jgi:hypothetical protein
MHARFNSKKIMSIFTVSYCPDISEEAENIIKDNITPSMVSQEGDSGQYCISHILSEIKEQLSEKDAEAISLLSDANVAYIEF